MSGYTIFHKRNMGTETFEVYFEGKRVYYVYDDYIFNFGDVKRIIEKDKEDRKWREEEKKKNVEE